MKNQRNSQVDSPGMVDLPMEKVSKSSMTSSKSMDPPSKRLYMPDLLAKTILTNCLKHSKAHFSLLAILQISMSTYVDRWKITFR